MRVCLGDFNSGAQARTTAAHKKNIMVVAHSERYPPELLGGKQIIDQDLAIVLNLLAAFAAVVVLATNDQAAARVTMLFGEDGLFFSVLVRHPVHDLAARGFLALEGGRGTHRNAPFAGLIDIACGARLHRMNSRVVRRGSYSPPLS